MSPRGSVSPAPGRAVCVPPAPGGCTPSGATARAFVVQRPVALTDQGTWDYRRVEPPPPDLRGRRVWYPRGHTPVVDLAQPAVFVLTPGTPRCPVHLWVRSGVEVWWAAERYTRGPASLHVRSISIEPGGRIYFWPGAPTQHESILLEFHATTHDPPRILAGASWIGGIPVQRINRAWQYCTGTQESTLATLDCCRPLLCRIEQLERSGQGSLRLEMSSSEPTELAFCFMDLVDPDLLATYEARGLDALVARAAGTD